MAKKRLKPALKGFPYHTESLWALIAPAPDGTHTHMCYLLQSTEKGLWQAVVDLQFMGTGHTKETLQAAGWRACKVFVEEKGNGNR